jgi:hypothetical protein
LKVFSIAGRTDSSGAAQPDTDQEEMRLLATMLLRQGIGPNALDLTPHPDAFKVRQDTGSNMQVRIGSGTAKRDLAVLRGAAAGQGVYIVRLDATEVTVTVPATDASTTFYAAFLFVNDAAYSGDASRAYAQFEVLKGAGSYPSARAQWSAALELWRWTLPASDTAVTNADLDAGTDLRKVADVAGVNPFEIGLFL